MAAVWEAARVSRVETLVSFFGDRRTDPGPVVPARPDVTAEQAALIAEACSKSGALWVRPLEDARSHLAWHAWHDGAVHVVYGVGEQMLPTLSGHAEVQVPSKDDRSTLVVFLAAAQVLPPHSPEWDAAVEALAKVRLNAVETDGQTDRWASGCLVSRLDPISVLGSGHGSRQDPAGRATPPGNPGTTMVRRPWHFRGRKRRD
jgi:hypothetical protein